MGSWFARVAGSLGEAARNGLSWPTLTMLSTGQTKILDTKMLGDVFKDQSKDQCSIKLVTTRQ